MAMALHLVVTVVEALACVRGCIVRHGLAVFFNHLRLPGHDGENGLASPFFIDAQIPVFGVAVPLDGCLGTLVWA